MSNDTTKFTVDIDSDAGKEYYDSFPGWLKDALTGKTAITTIHTGVANPVIDTIRGDNER